MSQSLVADFPIDPTTTSGDALADILNRQNSAINTSNAGPTQPPRTFPGQMWLDTSVAASPNGVLRMRDAANGAWVSAMGPVSAGAESNSTLAALGIPNFNQLTVDTAGTLKVPGTTVFGAATGTNFYAAYAGDRPILNFAAGVYLLYDPAAATLSYQSASGRNVAIDHMCNISTLGNVYCNTLVGSGGAQLSGNLTMVNGSIQGRDGSGIAFGPTDFSALHGGGYRIFQYATNWYWRWADASGDLQWIAAGAYATSFKPNGDFAAGGSVYNSGGVAMAGNAFTVTVFGDAGGGLLYSNALYGSPGGMFQAVSFQHLPGVMAAAQLQVGGQNFSFNSSGIAVSAGGWTTSDARLKTNIAPLEVKATDIVKAVPVVEFDRIGCEDAAGMPLHQIGWLAQDVQGVMPKLVGVHHATRCVPPLRTRTEEDTEDSPDFHSSLEDVGDQLTLADEGMVAVNWKATQELIARVEALEAR